MPDPTNNAAPNVPTTPVIGQTPQQAADQQGRQQAGRAGEAQRRQEELQQRADQPVQTFRSVSVRELGKGSLCVFKYDFFKHDPYPMMLVTSRYHDGKMAGVNLHYLTYRYVQYLVKQFCGRAGLSYQNIRGDRYIVNSFRTYKPNGMQNIKMVDCRALITILGRIRSFNPNEVKAIREEVERQLGSIKNPRIFPQPYTEYSERTPPPLRQTQGDKRYNPRGTTPIEE